MFFLVLIMCLVIFCWYLVYCFCFFYKFSGKRENMKVLLKQKNVEFFMLDELNVCMMRYILGLKVILG